jgi:hypothetical protein
MKRQRVDRRWQTVRPRWEKDEQRSGKERRALPHLGQYLPIKGQHLPAVLHIDVPLTLSELEYLDDGEEYSWIFHPEEGTPPRVRVRLFLDKGDGDEND